MTEITQTSSVETSALEFSEVFIGDCITGECERAATVRIYEDFVLCALHHAHYEAGQAEDDANLALGLINGWQSIANMHGHEYLIRLFNDAEKDLRERRTEARRRMDQLERADHESEPNVQIRLEMGALAGKAAQEKTGALPELSAFGRQLVAVTGYLGADLTRLARDMVHTAGGAYEEDRENVVPALEARMRSETGDELLPSFLAALVEGLALSEPEKAGLARAYAFDQDQDHPTPEGELSAST